jgi:hypothetical protein
MTTPRRPRRVRIALALATIAIVGSCAYVLSPRYVALPIDPPMAYLPRGDWWYEERAIRTWTDEIAPYYIWRASATAYGPGYQDWRDVTAYIEAQLIPLGWQRAYPNCVNQLPEAEFLAEGENGYLGFTRLGSNADEPGLFICLAVWPQDGQDSFNVVIQSFNPSLLLFLSQSFSA